MTLATLHRFKNSNTSYVEEGSGETVVFIHGVGMKAEAWAPQIEYFSDHYNVIAPDMPGHGHSQLLSSEASIQDYVNWAINFIENLNLGAVNLVGHSMGSLITLGVAATKPHLVKRIAVLNGVYQRSDEARNAILSRVEELNTGTIDIDTPIHRWFDNSESNQMIAEEIREWLSNININGYRAAYTAFANGDKAYAHQWPNIKCPTLILTGELDPNSTPEMAEIMAQKTANGKAVIIKNERHMVNLTAPTIVNQKLAEWLNTSVN